MTADQFVAWSEAVFGPYTAGMKAEVTEWLRPRSPFMVAALRQVALREHPSVYGKPPGVHELEAFRIEAQDRGHALEAIDAASRGRPLIPDITDPFVDAEFVNAKIDKLRERFNLRREVS